MSNWQDVLHSPTKRNEEVDIDEEAISADIDRILKTRPYVGVSSSALKAAEDADGGEYKSSSMPMYDDVEEDMLHIETDEGRLDGIDGMEGKEDGGAGPSSAPRSGGTPSSRRSGTNRRGSFNRSAVGTAAAAGAPETQARVNQARIKYLQKQVEDNADLRNQLYDQLKDVQKSLSIEREENKRLKKRLQVMEADTRRNANRRDSSMGNSDALENLTQENLSLKKELQTAERLARKTDTDSKAKDVQLKRAVETINRMKAQLTELQQVNQGSSQEDRTRIETAEGRVKVLERQRLELINAFRKQMKLIDVLKRQKVHIEAARLLAFTEEEFLGALNWAV